MSDIEIGDIFSPSGHLAESIPGFEYRQEQLHMAEFITERLCDAENGLIEAGTGTGKTLAYLVPVILFALENDRRVHITTETKTLQKQLMDKDIPLVARFLKESFGLDFSYSLCLGGANYVCRRRFEAAVMRGRFSTGELKVLEPVGKLLQQGKTFSRFNVRVPSDIWYEICREGDACNPYRCGFQKSCAFQLARKEWAESRILVMNHYLFFTNVASGKTYLPPADIVVFDEAHSVDDIATGQLGFSLGYTALLEILSRFQRERKRHGLLNGIPDKKLRESIQKILRDLPAAAATFFEQMRSLLGREKYHLRLRESRREGIPLAEKLKELMLLLSQAEEAFEDESQKMEFDIARGRLFAYLEGFISFVYQNREDFVYWIERSRNELLGDVFLCGQPIDVSEIIRREVIASFDSSIFVSATLAIGGDFSFMVKRLGVERHRELALDSSFNFREQAILFLDQSIRDPGSDRYAADSSRISAEIIRHLNGNCLMLFTSYRMLAEIRQILEPMIEQPVYSQDLLSSAEAMEQYLGSDNSILMGTHSFWQGIDLPGDLLRGVIMMKLPFSVPDYPPVEARTERLQQQGLNPFYTMQVPEAVIKFKQGFGRLIRTRSDRGVVAVLDSRILNKPYGKYFLRALPECTVVRSLEELFRAYERLGW